MTENKTTDKIKDAIQPEGWYKVLPREDYKSLEMINNTQSWFEVYILPNNVYAIYEPGHFQEVISYLIIGSDGALLLDTGMGIGNMKTLVDELTDLPVTVVLSHSHFDHIGCNHQFDNVHVMNHPGAVKRITEGMDSADLIKYLEGDSTWIPYPDGFDLNNYAIPGCNPVTIEDGHIFNLGDRELKVIHTPGHSPDSIMLFDEDSGILFTGDTFYPATLYAHLDSPEGIDSNIAVYRKTMEMLCELEGVEKLYCSHNEPVRPPCMLRMTADALMQVELGKMEYEEDEYGLKKYCFDGFAVVTK